MIGPGVVYSPEPHARLSCLWHLENRPRMRDNIELRPLHPTVPFASASLLTGVFFFVQ